MSVPMVTSFYAAICTLLVLVLGGRVVMLRRRERVGIGHGKSRELSLAVRVHGNAIENIPLALLLLLLLELLNMSHLWLHFFGSLIFIGRILHAWGLGQTEGVSPGRLVGMLVTWTTMGVMAFYLLFLYCRLTLS